MNEVERSTQPTSSHAQRPSKRPNLLFIQTDQQRQDTLGAYGNDGIKTTNLDALAARSFVFERAYVAQPQCSPSRASLLTGLYPHTHGTVENNVPLTRDFPTLPEMICDPDYAKGHFGKWHLGDEIFPQRGFAEFESTESGYRDDFAEGRDRTQLCGYSRFLLEQGIACDLPHGHSRRVANEVPVELSKPAYIARRAVNFVERHRDRPFALYLSFLEPHNFADHQKPPPLANHYDHLYDRDAMQVPDTFFEAMDPTVSFIKRTVRSVIRRGGVLPAAYPRTIDELRDAKARYWGLVTLIDEMIGRVLSRLVELRLLDDTIVVFTSDHGEMLGDHRLLSKVSYEEALRVPLLLSVPGLHGRARRISQPVSHVDLVPTLLDLMSQPKPRHLQGESWADYLSSVRPFPERDVFIEDATPPWLFDRLRCCERIIVTSNGWKLIVSEAGDGELYNLRDDPRERVNLYFQDRYRPVVVDLNKRIRNWQCRTGDKLKLDLLDAPWPSVRPIGTEDDVR